MPLAPTPEYDFNLPEPGGDTDDWGGLLNDNWTDLDALLKGLQDRVQKLEDQALIIVGGLYLSVSATNPATSLGYGTWVQHADGRALVGVGNNGESGWQVNGERGSEIANLTLDNIPAHTHAVSVDLSSNGAHTHLVRQDRLFVKEGTEGTVVSVLKESSGTFGSATNETGTHSHVATVSQTSRGNGNPHNNVQPSIAVYVWRRTA